MVTDLNSTQQILSSSLLLGAEGYWANSGLPVGSTLTASWFSSSRRVVVLNHRDLYCWQGHSFWWKGAPGDMPTSDCICSLPLFQAPGCLQLASTLQRPSSSLLQKVKRGAVSV